MALFYRVLINVGALSPAKLGATPNTTTRLILKDQLRKSCRCMKTSRLHQIFSLMQSLVLMQKATVERNNFL